MLKTSDPVQILPGIGQKYLNLLEQLNIFTIEDLLMHIPFRYEDYRNELSIADVKASIGIEGGLGLELNPSRPSFETRPVVDLKSTVTLQAELIEAKNIFTKNGKKITRATLRDNTGEIGAVWFNQHYITKVLKVGQKYSLNGKIGSFNNKPCLMAPEFELTERGTTNTTGLVPVYSTTQGVSTKWLRSRIKDTVEQLGKRYEIENRLPDEIAKKHNILEKEEAFRKVHFPVSEQDVELAKRSLGFEELLKELIKVYIRKEQWKKEFTGININHAKFEQEIDTLKVSLPFRLTNTQEKATQEIFSDLNTISPMNRLLEGDVGSGKTIVAVMASYLCWLNGYNTLYMAPTEILANQHYETYKQFLGGFGVDIRLHTRNIKGLGDLKATAGKNAPGGGTTGGGTTKSIIIGTHALLYETELKDVGLIVIDEQHRFGVEQRGRILELGSGEKKPNLLTMTATPIPRTLALTIYGDLDISVLDSVPNTDKEIATKVVNESDRDKVFKWIEEKGEQAFIVCPFIEKSEAVAFENVKAAKDEFERLKGGVFKNVSMGLLHGKMKPKEKDEIMDKFKKGEIRVLVSTPVIEVGVDIPEATIMVIESAERYGLASLHQLRGRVGRGAKKGYCFLFMSGYAKNSYARLKNLEKIDNGLKLAEIDLTYRGQGDIFGTMQHGFKDFKVADINDVGLVKEARTAADMIFDNTDKYSGYIKYAGEGFIPAN